VSEKKKAHSTVFAKKKQQHNRTEENRVRVFGDKMRALLVLAVVASVALSDVMNCKYTANKDGSSSDYDLSSLIHTAEPDFRATDDPGHVYYFNVCNDVMYSGCSDMKAGVCQYARSGAKNCGLTAQMKFFPTNATGVANDKGVLLAYTGGDPCDGGPIRQSLIYFHCSTDVEPSIGQVVEDECAYSLTVEATVGCGKSSGGGSSGLSAGGIILIVLVVLIVVYFAGGAVYQWKINNAQAPSEFIIHRDFWFAIPLLVKDGACFIAHGFKKGDYTAV
jgi:hypothetical protein